MIDKKIAVKEVERLRKWGQIPPGGDLFGVWFLKSLTGKRTTIWIDKNGKEYSQDEKLSYDDKHIPYTHRIESNSDTELFFDDVHKISMRWDQWVEVYIECRHGKFTGSSDFFNVTEAMMRAVVAFNEVDHPWIPYDEEEDVGE